MSTWTVDRSKILQPDEITLVLTDLRREARRSTNSRMNLIVFRLATCCGLRASEIAGLTLADVLLSVYVRDDLWQVITSAASR